MKNLGLERGQHGDVGHLRGNDGAFSQDVRFRGARLDLHHRYERRFLRFTLGAQTDPTDYYKRHERQADSEVVSFLHRFFSLTGSLPSSVSRQDNLE